MSKNGKIKLETLKQTSKKKKDFLIVSGVVLVFVLVAFSVFNYSLDIDEKKIFKKKELSGTESNDVNLTTPDGIKESWAISIENSMDDATKKTDRLIKLMEKNAENSKAETSAIITEMMKSQEETLFRMRQTLERKEAQMAAKLEEALLTQRNELERIKSEANKIRGGGSQNKISEDDIEFGLDLLPKIKIKKDPKDTTKINSILDGTVDVNKTTKVPATKEYSEDPFGNKVIRTTSSAHLVDEPKVKEKRKFTFKKIDTSKSLDTIISEKRLELAQIKKREKQKNSYHIMTGLTQGFLITGVYAPAFSEGKSDPIPVLIQAEGNILIANDDTQSLSGCFFLGSAKGNMNSQTADIRLNKISCSLADGAKKIEGTISGWVIGENGIPGVQGELLHKNGAWMAKTFVSGFLETFSKSAVGFSSQSGNTQTIGSGLIESGSQSTSDVFSKMGEYYLKMAEQIFPVIEVKPGRNIDIMLQGGSNLTVTDFNSAEIDQIEIELIELENEKKRDSERKSEINSDGLVSDSSDSLENVDGINNKVSVNKSDTLFED